MSSILHIIFIYLSHMYTENSLFGMYYIEHSYITTLDVKLH